MQWISAHLGLIGYVAGGIVALDSYLMPFLPTKYNGIAAVVNKVAGNVQAVAQQAQAPKGSGQ